MRPLSLTELYQDLASRLQLSWVSGNLEIPRPVSSDAASAADLVGHLNLIHTRRIQVFGHQENAYYERIGDASRAQHTQDLQVSEPLALIIAEDLPIPPDLANLSKIKDIPLFKTPLAAAAVIDHLRIYVTKRLSPSVLLHGVFMDVLGLGILITGDSGLGKSELGLDLITRGHGLIADDMTEFSRISPDVIEGRCPPLLQNFLEVRGLGLLDIRAIFGETALRRKMRLRLIVHLERKDKHDWSGDRLGLDRATFDVLEVPIRKVVIPVAAGRNLAVLLEAAVRNTVLQLRGIDSMAEFSARQAQVMAAENNH